MVLNKIFGDKDVKPLHFARKVSAGTSGTFTYNVRKDGTIENLDIRIYSGAEDELEIDVYVVNQESGLRRKVVETPDDQSYIGGNEDFFQFRASQEVTSDDQIEIDYNNTDGNNPHRYKINVEIDRTGGTLSNLLR